MNSIKLLIKQIFKIINKILIKSDYKILLINKSIKIASDSRRIRKKLNLSKSNLRLANRIAGLTMVSNSNIEFLIDAINYTKIKKIKGDYVETGVWKGGLSILAFLCFGKNKINKKFILFDTFEGMSKPTSFDKKRNKSSKEVFKKWQNSINSDSKWNYASLDDVKQNILKLCGKKNIKYFRFIKGKVEQTLKDKKNLPNKISLLRLDTDFYASTKSELKYLFSLVSKGGIIIFDDYSNWLGAKKAIDEFFKNKKYLLTKIDNNSRFIIK